MQARVDDFAMGTLRSVPSDDPEVLRRTEALRTALTASLVPLEAYIDGLRPHEELLRREEVAWCKEFAARPEDSPPISLKEIRAEVAAQRKAEAALEASLPTEMVIGMFSVAVGTLRASLVAKHRACVEQLLLLVAERAREECAVVCKAFGEMHTQVTGCHCHHHRLLYHSHLHLTPLFPPALLQVRPRQRRAQVDAVAPDVPKAARHEEAGGVRPRPEPDRRERGDLGRQDRPVGAQGRVQAGRRVGAERRGHKGRDASARLAPG